MNKIETETKTETEMKAEIPSDIVESLITKENRVKGRKWQQRLEKNKQKAKTFLPKKYRIKRRRDRLIFIRIQVSTKK